MTTIRKSQLLHYLTMEYASYFLTGIGKIDRRREIRLKEIEDKILDMGVEWSTFSEMVLEQFEGMDKNV